MTLSKNDFNNLCKSTVKFEVKICLKAWWCNCRHTCPWGEDTVMPSSCSHWKQRPHWLSWFRRDVSLACTVYIFLYGESGYKPGRVRCEDKVWDEASRSLCVWSVPQATRSGEDSGLIVLTIIFPFSSHLASLFIHIRATCKLEHAEMLSFGQECFQRAPCCSERVLSSWLHWAVEQAKRC